MYYCSLDLVDGDLVVVNQVLQGIVDGRAVFSADINGRVIGILSLNRCIRGYHL